MRKTASISQSMPHANESFAHWVPAYIFANLRHGKRLRPYQLEAIGRFVYYWEQGDGRSTQLLFHMATGSGKTVIMAALILYLYEQGFRNVLFFVNSSTIIDKTRRNFLECGCSKYLFADKTVINHKPLQIREVDNFQSVQSFDLNIVFCTIQGLHTALNNPRENGLTIDDFNDHRVLLISDEAHHINAETKKGKVDTSDVQQATWESTVNKILAANKHNLLLEFTATTDFSCAEIAAKYNEKVMFDYPLKQFRIDGYSKEVKVLQSNLQPFERALMALMLSQYRLKVFQQHGLVAKPVILLKSKNIKESHDFYDTFHTSLQQLSDSDIRNCFGTNMAVLNNLQRYLVENQLSIIDFIDELKLDFDKERCIIINSTNECEQNQLAINSLEDSDNPYRLIFAVDKLNEGWDVLNLFDIVRLYDTRDGKAGNPGRTTMSEAQLIGRGARYYPFPYNASAQNDVRRFDDDVTHDLRICEELYYHCSYNPLYIQELNTALVQIGMVKEKDEKLSKGVKTTDGQRDDATIFLIDEAGNRIGFGAAITSKALKCAPLHHQLLESNAFEKSTFGLKPSTTLSINLSDFDHRTIRKSLMADDLFLFANLKRIFPSLLSLDEFMLSPHYLGQLKIDIQTHHFRLSDFSAHQQFYLLKEALKPIIEILGRV